MYTYLKEVAYTLVLRFVKSCVKEPNPNITYGNDRRVIDLWLTAQRLNIIWPEPPSTDEVLSTADKWKATQMYYVSPEKVSDYDSLEEKLMQPSNYDIEPPYKVYAGYHELLVQEPQEADDREGATLNTVEEAEVRPLRDQAK